MIDYSELSDDLKKQIQAAKESQSAGDVPKALSLWKHISLAEPGYLPARVRIVGILCKLKQYDEAEIYSQSFVNYAPTDEEALVWSARVAQSQRQNQLALSRWKKVIELFEANSEAHLEMGVLYGQVENWDDALSELERSIELEPNDARALIWAARFCQKAGLTSQGLAYWKKVVDLTPSNSSAVVWVARLSQQKGLHEQALLYWQKSLLLEPSDFESCFEISRILYQLHRLGESEEFALKAIDLKPTNLPALSHYIELLQHADRADEALSYVLQSLNESPENFALRIQAIRLLSKNSRFEEAARLFQDAHYQTSLNMKEKLELANLAETANLVSEAHTIFQECLTTFSNEPEPFLEYSSFLMHYGYFGHAYNVLQSFSGDTNAQFNEERETIIKAARTCEFVLDNNDTTKNEAFLIPETLIPIFVERVQGISLQYEPESKMNIALVIHSLGPGGAERQCANLAKALSEEFGSEGLVSLLCRTLSRGPKDRFYLETLEGSSVNVKEYSRDTVSLATNGSCLDPYSDLLELIEPVSRRESIKQLALELAELKPSVVYALLDETIFHTAIAALIAGVPQIIGRWGNLPPDQIPFLSETDQEKKRCLRLVYKNLTNVSNISFISNSRVTADAYADWLEIDRAYVKAIHNGIDFSPVPRSKNEGGKLRARLHIPDSAPVVGGVFQLTHKKQPFLWVETAQRVLESCPEAYFVIVGDGQLKTELEHYLSSHSLEERVKLVGRQDNIYEWYATMNLFLLTSRAEGLPNVVIEAQASGVPAVLPNVGGCSEAIEHGRTGWIIDPATAESLAERIVYSLEDKNWYQEASKASSSRALSSFSIDSLLKNTLGLIDSLSPTFSRAV